MSRASAASFLLGASALASSTAASPPPPPRAFIDDIAKQLVGTAARFDDYARLLADDLTVTLNGKTVASNRAQWLAIERDRVGKVDRRVYGYAEGRDDILVIDGVDDRSDERCPQGRTCVFDPRYRARAVQYQLGSDHLIHAIRIVQSDGFLRTR